MFNLAILIGIYSYLIFLLGVLSLLYWQWITLATILILAVVLIVAKQELGFREFMKIKPNKNSLLYFGERIPRCLAARMKPPKELSAPADTASACCAVVHLFLILLFIQAVINLVGALGPELAFDALWYHLTLPKLYLLQHSIKFVEGGLLYYSAMPQLTEMLYVSALALHSEILAKLIQFLFGILTSVVIYKLTRKFFDSWISILAVVIFYSNLVVAWESTTAYVDLVRTFFEVMALWAFVNWQEREETSWLVQSSIMLGLATSTKILSAGSLLVFSVLIIMHLWNKQSFSTNKQSFSTNKKEIPTTVSQVMLYWLIALVVALPWFIYSLVNTGNPVYPLFAQQSSFASLTDLIIPHPPVGGETLLHFIKEVWIVLTKAADPISPVYLLLLPLIFVYFRSFSTNLRFIAIYSLLSLIVWYITPRSGGGRFLLPYLPAFSITAAAAVYYLKDNRSIRRLCIAFILLTALVTIFYRGLANARYLKVILALETKAQFMDKNLEFEVGNFYDTDGYFKDRIQPTDKILLYGFQNLYYVDFPFIDSSWVKSGDKFNYIAVQAGKLPEVFKEWKMIYQNPKTKVKLYTWENGWWIY